MILNINGSAIPVPAPCNIRAVISIGKFNVQAAIRQPVMQSHHSVMPGSLLEWRLFAQKYKKILGSGALYQGSSYY